MNPREEEDALRRVSDVSRETVERLRLYANLLQKWTRKINLIAKSTSYDIWARHIIDSAQLWPHRNSTSDHWGDLGSGGGLPGLVMAILAAEHQPGLRTTLVESDTRKSVFLRQVIHELSLNAEVVNRRIEDAPPLDAGTISARALAPLPRLLPYCARHLSDSPEAKILLLKGRNAEAELTEARNFWTFDVNQVPSVTDPEAVLLQIGALKRA